jgi:hypothetical protein
VKSLISALSVRLPRSIFYPDDADVVADIDTAKACNDIKELIEKHNNGIMLFMKALYFMWNQGVACAYIYNRASNEYGTVSIPQYGEDVNVITALYTCPSCNLNLGSEEFKNTEPVERTLQCPQCMMEVSPHTEYAQELLPQITGYTDEAKSRTIIDVFGPMYAQMPFYARKQEHIPYLMLRFEQHEALLKSLYPDFRDKNWWRCYC